MALSVSAALTLLAPSAFHSLHEHGSPGKQAGAKVSLLTACNKGCSHSELFAGNCHLRTRAILRRHSHSSKALIARASVASVVEPATGVSFPSSLVPPGGSDELALVGAGVREKTFAIVSVKVYGVALYLSEAAAAALTPWSGKGASELAKDASFYKAIVDSSADKSIFIVLVRDVEGSQFWNALNEALAPRLKAAGASDEALKQFGKVLESRSLKKNTGIYLTSSQSSTLHVGISEDVTINPTPSEPTLSVESSALVEALFDVYLGSSLVSQSLVKDVAEVLGKK